MTVQTWYPFLPATTRGGALSKHPPWSLRHPGIVGKKFRLFQLIYIIKSGVQCWLWASSYLFQRHESYRALNVLQRPHPYKMEPPELQSVTVGILQRATARILVSPRSKNLPKPHHLHAKTVLFTTCAATDTSQTGNYRHIRNVREREKRIQTACTKTNKQKNKWEITCYITE